MELSWLLLQSIMPLEFLLNFSAAADVELLAKMSLKNRVFARASIDYKFFEYSELESKEQLTKFIINSTVKTYK